MLIERQTSEVSQDSTGPDLKAVLDRYYRVEGKAFGECDSIEISKHQVLHLAKLNKKLLEYWSRPTASNRAVVSNEVTPDLLIYAQELMMKFGHKWWSPSRLPPPNTAFKIRALLESEIGFADIEQTVASVCVATAALADICDQSDHGQVSNFQIEADVIDPFLQAAETLCRLLGLNMQAIYLNRLEYMRCKYESWS